MALLRAWFRRFYRFNNLGLFYRLALQLSPQLIEQFLQRRVIEFIDTAAREHDGIDTAGADQCGLSMAKTFSDDALDAVALGGAAHVLLCYYESESGVIKSIDAGEDQKLFAGDPQLGSIEYLLKICGRQ